LALNVEINPAKSTDPTAPDLLVNGRIADLKVQNTPFFTASSYSMDPQFTVTFNRKDYERYDAMYPEIEVYFWINWTQLSWKNYSVKELNSVFKANFSALKSKIVAGAVEHTYQHRQNDRVGNAKSSFLFDVRTFDLIADLKT